MQTNPNLQVLLLFGGESSEHEVSISSATNVFHALDKDKYDIDLVYITKKGEWLGVSSIGNFEETKKVIVNFSDKKILLNDEQKSFDVVFPVLHGAHGEDGDVQGLARLLGVPVVGPSLIGAALTMDKDVTKQLAKNAGVEISNSIVWRTCDSLPDYGEISSQLSTVLFVKPVNAGSSVGVSRVTSSEEFVNALNDAAQHDSLVLIEEAIVGREVELAVMGNDAPVVSEPGEILPGEEFYSYEDKYAETSTARVVIPADLPTAISSKLKADALIAYKSTRGRGMARVDFFVAEDGRVILNEINSIPGFTNISMYPKLWMAANVSYSELLDKIIGFALEK